MKILIVFIVLMVLLLGCSRQNNQTSNPPPSGGQEAGQQAMPEDVTDYSFRATISPTKYPAVFKITVKLVNNKIDKRISGTERVFPDVTLKDSEGNIYTGKILDQTYVKEVDYDFDPSDVQSGTTSHTGRVRLLTKKLKPGTYTVIPKVRIVEVGNDAVFGPHMDMGSVAIPAANSVEVTISK